MMQTRALEIRLGDVVAWTVPVAASAGLLGGPWTLQMTGPEGVVAESASFLVVLGVVLASLLMIKWIVRRSLAKHPGINVAFVISQAFVVGSLAKVLSAVLAGVVVWYCLGLCTRPFFVWLAAFYLLMLMGESIWLTRLLKSGTKSGCLSGQDGPGKGTGGPGKV